jgi:3-deoxy-D-manno-oct-2-ulosonic acid (Kdo) hydroxylase
MQTIEATESCVARVGRFETEAGWKDDAEAPMQSRWCCEQLEQGRILLFETFPFEFPVEDRAFLLAQRMWDPRAHKNISYRPRTDVLRGFHPPEPEIGQRMHDVMRRYSGQVVAFLRQLLVPYAALWSLDHASFRPELEEGRKLPLRKRNDLIHVDAFPRGPTRGARILRCFTNINPNQPRVWQTTDAFPELARAHAREAGLDRAVGAWGTRRLRLGRALGLIPKGQTAYDRFMLRFHDWLKQNSAFQKSCRKTTLAFRPGATWICFTDALPHAVLSGQYAVEQTLIVPLSAMLKPEQAPLRVLENLAGRSLGA